MNIGIMKEKIEMHRMGRGMSQDLFCERVGISRVTYWRFRKGRVDGVSVEVLLKMLEVLGVEVMLLRKEDLG